MKKINILEGQYSHRVTESSFSIGEKKTRIIATSTNFTYYIQINKENLIARFEISFSLREIERLIPSAGILNKYSMNSAFVYYTHLMETREKDEHKISFKLELTAANTELERQRNDNKEHPAAQIGGEIRQLSRTKFSESKGTFLNPVYMPPFAKFTFAVSQWKSVAQIQFNNSLDSKVNFHRKCNLLEFAHLYWTPLCNLNTSISILYINSSKVSRIPIIKSAERAKHFDRNLNRIQSQIEKIEERRCGVILIKT